MIDWEQVKSSASETSKMEKLVKGYSYVDESSATATDGKVCQIIIDRIRGAKNILFNIIEFLYEIEKKRPVSRHMQKLKDELDIFSDEVKVRYCSWKGLNLKWTIELIRHDLDLLNGLDMLNTHLQRLYESLLSDKSLLNESGPSEELLFKKMENRLCGIESRMDEMVKLFKEREGIVNLRPLSLEKTFKQIQERIDRQI